MITERTPGDLEECVRIVGDETELAGRETLSTCYIPIAGGSREKWVGPAACTTPPTNSMPPVIANDPPTPQRL